MEISDPGSNTEGIGVTPCVAALAMVHAQKAMQEHSPSVFLQHPMKSARGLLALDHFEDITVI